MSQAGHTYGASGCVYFVLRLCRCVLRVRQMRECFPTSCFTRNPIPIRNTTQAHHAKSQQVCTVAPRPEQDCAIMKERVICTVLTCGGSIFVFPEIVFQKKGPAGNAKNKKTRTPSVYQVVTSTNADTHNYHPHTPSKHYACMFWPS